MKKIITFIAASVMSLSFANVAFAEVDLLDKKPPAKELMQAKENVKKAKVNMKQAKHELKKAKHELKKAKREHKKQINGEAL